MSNITDDDEYLTDIETKLLIKALIDRLASVAHIAHFWTTPDVIWVAETARRIADLCDGIRYEDDE